MNFTTWLKLLTANLISIWLVFLVQPLFEKSILFNLFFNVQVVLLVIMSYLLILYFNGRIE